MLRFFSVRVLKNLQDTEITQAPIRITKDTFEWVYELYWKKLFSYCYYHIQNKEDATDLVQEIFLSLWKKRDQLQIRQVENYLFRSASFEITDFYRRRNVRALHAQHFSSVYINAENATENLVWFTELSSRIDDLLDQLPERCREVYRLSRIEGKSHEQIKTDLSISENTVKAHLQHALSFLKSRLVIEEY